MHGPLNIPSLMEPGYYFKFDQISPVLSNFLNECTTRGTQTSFNGGRRVDLTKFTIEDWSWKVYRVKGLEHDFYLMSALCKPYYCFYFSPKLEVSVEQFSN